MISDFFLKKQEKKMSDKAIHFAVKEGISAYITSVPW